ncbi:MAG: VanW family protein [Chloroflexi bacterium]|nr:VanW family protein [Chloroflexota bacterium]
MSALSYPFPRRFPVVAQILTAAIGGLMLFFGVIIIWVLGYQLLYAGRIFPGVSVAGVDLSGLSPEAAALKLNQTLSYPINGKVLFQYGDKAWVASPAQLGMAFDASSSARAAYRLGRSGGLFAALDGQIRARGFGYDVAPVILFDQRVAYQYLQGLSQQVNQPVVQASIRLNGTDVTAQPGQPGRTLNVSGTLLVLSAQLQTFRDGEVPLVVDEVQPTVADLTSQANLARQILSAPLELVIPNAQAGDAGPWVYDPQVLANMIGAQTVQNGNKVDVQLTLDPNALRQILTGIEPQIDRAASNPLFHFNETTKQLVLLSPSVTGRSLDVDASLKAITDALMQGQHTVPLAVKEVQPALTGSATAQQLGITQVVSQQTTYFWGSDPARIQNITTAAARFDGVLVAPGETFSMGQTLGDISLNNGYAEALIIYGNQTIKGVGGGVCQVSTTLFRTVFFGGFPVVERIPHAYRVSYYEETSSGSDNVKMAGLDATVYFPLVDFQFKNDSQYWILMETNVDVGSRSLTWTFYSTADGRSVQWNTTGPQNVVPAPDAKFVVNPDLKAGQMKQTDWAANGADVDVTRTVMKDGAVYFQDEFKTHYEAWQAVCEYAQGMPNPKQIAKNRNMCQPPASS